MLSTFSNRFPAKTFPRTSSYRLRYRKLTSDWPCNNNTWNCKSFFYFATATLRYLYIVYSCWINCVQENYFKSLDWQKKNRNLKLALARFFMADSRTRCHCEFGYRLGKKARIWQECGNFPPAPLEINKVKQFILKAIVMAQIVYKIWKNFF